MLGWNVDIDGSLKSMTIKNDIKKHPITNSLDDNKLVQEHKEHLSLYTFKYTVDATQGSRITHQKSVHDIMMYGDTLVFQKNQFDLDWNSGNPRSIGSDTVEFSVNSSSPIRITPVSRRARRIGWIHDEHHTFNTLLKGLFGEMLLSTGIVPVERSIDNQGLNGNEPFTGYITARSLQRSITQDASTYFSQCSDGIVEDLKKFYRQLWNQDETEFVNIFHENNGLLEGDILKIPVYITLRYAIRWSINKENRVVEGTWCMLYHFNVTSNLVYIEFKIRVMNSLFSVVVLLFRFLFTFDWFIE